MCEIMAGSLQKRTRTGSDASSIVNMEWSFYEVESHYLTVKYINAEDVIDSCSCLYLQKRKTFLYIVICLPTEHLGVQMNLLKRVRAFQFELEFKMLDF